ncbi:MAG TPA: ABC transporter ATP-binding protein [Actinomycetota bacterium]
MPLLAVEDLRAGYGTVPALHGVSLEVEEREIVAVLGPNGAGKTTTLSAISGLIKPWSGRVVFDGADIGGATPTETVALGIAHVPEGRHVFPALSVEENLKIGSWAQRKVDGSYRTNVERVFGYFPRLRERKNQLAGTLSGGEQQMLAIGRALMSAPRLLIIDEAALGLAPVMVDTVFEIVKAIRDDGNTVLLVEQNAPVTLALADRVYLMQRGEIVTGGPSAEVRERGVLDAYLGPMAAAARAMAGDPASKPGNPGRNGSAGARPARRKTSRTGRKSPSSD